MTMILHKPKLDSGTRVPLCMIGKLMSSVLTEYRPKQFEINKVTIVIAGIEGTKVKRWHS